MSFNVSSGNILPFLGPARPAADIDPEPLQFGAGPHHDSRHYAELIARHRITNFTFSYEKGCFSAINAAGEELASAETIRGLLDSL